MTHRIKNILLVSALILSASSCKNEIKEISKTDAQALLKLCEPGMIDKTRYEVKIGAHIFEIDEFYGDNNGLVVAEVELNNTTETFLKPDWLGIEVTGDLKYYNSQLSKNPYKNWNS